MALISRMDKGLFIICIIPLHIECEVKYSDMKQYRWIFKAMLSEEKSCKRMYMIWIYSYKTQTYKNNTELLDWKNQYC